MSKTKNQLVCPRCKQEKENRDCLYDVDIAVLVVKGSTNYGIMLEEFDYQMCGQCLDKIQEYIRDWKSKTKTKGTGPSNETQTLTQNHSSQQTAHRQVRNIGKVKGTFAASY
jgi:hypothetical protein